MQGGMKAHDFFDNFSFLFFRNKSIITVVLFLLTASCFFRGGPSLLFFRPKHHVGFYLLEQRFLVAADFPSFFVPGQVLVDLQKSEKNSNTVQSWFSNTLCVHKNCY